MLTKSDNRHYFRMMVNADVKLMINDPETGRVIDGICRDLSASGMSIEVDEPLEMLLTGGHLLCFFVRRHVPCGQGHSDRPIG